MPEAAMMLAGLYSAPDRQSTEAESSASRIQWSPVRGQIREYCWRLLE